MRNFKLSIQFILKSKDTEYVLVVEKKIRCVSSPLPTSAPNSTAMFSLSWWCTWNSIRVWCPPPQPLPDSEFVFSSFTKAKNTVGLKTNSIHSHYPSWYLKYMNKCLSSHHWEPSHRIKTPYLAGNVMSCYYYCYYYYCYFHIAYEKTGRQWDPKLSTAVVLTILLFTCGCKFPGII